MLQLMKTPAPLLGPSPVKRARCVSVLVVALAMMILKPMPISNIRPRQKGT